MRTTLDLSDDLLRQAKITAIRKGMTLRELVSQALTKELAFHAQAEKPIRVDFPLLRSSSPDRQIITTEMVKQVEEDDDLRRSGLLD